MDVGQAAFLAGAGFLGGAVNAVAGGGSLIVFPAMVASGLGTLVANVTNSVAAWPGNVGAVAGFREELVGQRRRGLTLSVAAGIGSGAGCVLLLATPESAFDLVVPFLVLAASLLLAAQPWLSKHIRPVEGRDHGKAAYPAIAAAGTYGGYFGGALGVILLGMLALTVQDTLRRLNAQKSLLQVVVASVTVAVFGVFGPVDWAAVAAVAPASLVGGFAGARVARRLNDRLLRWCVVVLGLTVAVLLFLR